MPNRVKEGIEQLGGVAAMGIEGTLAIRKGFPFKEFIEQCWFIARVTVVPVTLISIPFGVVLALHVGSLLGQVGAESDIGAVIVLGIVREASPVATALLIAGAGGSAMTADLGSRRIRDELDAMEVMGVDPIQRLVLPRLAAATLVAILLNGVVSVAGVMGGWVMAVPVEGGTSGAYFSSFTELSHLPDFWSAEIKAMLFGFLAAAISCWYGYSVRGGPKAVGDAVNRAVVLTFVVLFFVNFVLSALYFQLIPPKVL